MSGVYCGRLEGEHLVVRDNSTDYTVGTTLYVSCEEGFRLTGLHFVTCNTDGSWTNHPECKEKQSSNTSSPLIIAVSTVASVVALVIIVVAVYMLFRNFRREKRIKKQEDDYQKKIWNFSEYFAMSQDCVGMPALIFDNIDNVMRGRTSISTATSISSIGSPDSTETGASTDKIFIY